LGYSSSIAVVAKPAWGKQLMEKWCAEKGPEYLLDHEGKFKQNIGWEAGYCSWMERWDQAMSSQTKSVG